MIQDCKIKVNSGESRIVQEIAFEHGYEWAVHKRQICHREAPYLFIDNSDMTINYGDSEGFFNSLNEPQISFQEFFEKYALKKWKFNRSKWKLTLLKAGLFKKFFLHMDING